MVSDHVILCNRLMFVYVLIRSDQRKTIHLNSVIYVMTSSVMLWTCTDQAKPNSDIPLCRVIMFSIPRTKLIGFCVPRSASHQLGCTSCIDWIYANCPPNIIPILTPFINITMHVIYPKTIDLLLGDVVRLIARIT